MAVSAFKSTTRRSCDVGLGGEEELPTVAVPFQPSTPLHKPRYRHRRSRSLSNFGSGYLSDSASVTGDANSRRLDSIFRHGKASSRRQSEDSESDADSMYSRHTYRSRQVAEFGASRKAALGAGKSKGISSNFDLRRSSSTLNGGYKEIADFLSCLDDDNDPESLWSPPRIAGRPSGNTKKNTDSVFSRFIQSEEFSQTNDRPLRASQNGKARATGTRAKELRRSSSQANSSGSAFHNLDYRSETDSSYSRPSFRARDKQSRADSGSRSAHWNPRPFESGFSSPEGDLEQCNSPGPLRESFDPSITSCSSINGGAQTASRQDEARFPEKGLFDVALSLSPRNNDVQISHPEEEKTIRAIHTQAKGSGAEDVDAVAFYDAMRVEMMKAVSEIRSEIEQKTSSKELALASSCLSNGQEISGHGLDGDTTSSIAEARQEYAVKLEESEKRAQDLWNQLAAEERRCEDLVQYVKELLLSQSGSDAKPETSLPPQVRPAMDPNVDRQLVSACLDADAQRYFDECVSISGIDATSAHGGSSCGIGYEENESPAWSVKDLVLSPRKKDIGRAIQKKSEVLRPLVTFCALFEQGGKCTGQSSRTPGISEVNADGIVLPWLKWESDMGSFKSNAKERGLFSGLRDNSRHNRAFIRSQSFTRWDSKSKSKVKEILEPWGLSGVSGLGCVAGVDLNRWKGLKLGHLSNLGAKPSATAGELGDLIDVDMFVLQRSWLSGQLKRGSILVCGGTRL